MAKKSKWDEIVESVRRSAGSRVVKVGVFASKGGSSDHDGVSVLELATIHEFGAPKAGIPERSFIRAGVRQLQKKPRFLQLTTKIAQKAFKDPGKRESALALLGTYAADQVKAFVTKGRNITPPLKAKTIAAKGSSRPLVDTGRLVNAITYVVEDKS